MKTLYHYCSVAAFHSIVEHQSIRISSLSLSNDSLEGRMARESVVRLAMHDGLPQEKIDKLVEFVSYFDTEYDGLGFCLSRAKDLLSQWRGYADDGRGFCIGFSEEHLRTMIRPKTNKIVLGAVRPALLKVQYAIEEHDASIKPVYDKMREAIAEGALERQSFGLLVSEEDRLKSYRRINTANEKLFSTITELTSNLYTLKSSVFREEQEWRILASVSNSLHRGSDFRPISDNLIPFRTLGLQDPKQENIIAEVILGPKNKTPIHLVKTFLKNRGFEGVEVSLSEASYR